MDGTEPRDGDTCARDADTDARDGSTEPRDGSTNARNDGTGAPDLSAGAPDGGETMAQRDRLHAALAKGVDEFNAREFYECHETLEEVWLQDCGDDHLFLQGLIQAAAAYHNLLRGKWSGGARLLDLALVKLGPYGASHHGVDLASFTQEMRQGRVVAGDLLRRGGGPFDERLLPQIHYVPSSG